MSILIDDRAGSRELINHVPLDVLGSLCHLDSADICFTGNTAHGTSLIAIEVKHITDLISSRQSNRLQSIDGQITRMLDDYDECWLLTYGSYRCGPTGDLEVPRKGKGGNYDWIPYTFNGGVGGKGKPVPYSFVTGAKISLTDVGFRCEHVHDLSQCALWIAALYAKRSKPWSEQCRMFRSLNQVNMLNEAAYKRNSDRSLLRAENESGILLSPMPGKVDPIEYQIASTAASFPSIKYERSMAIARHFDSPYEFINASVSELEKVDGIGKVIARSTYESIRRGKRR